MKIYLVGGAVRDELLGLPVKDFDYTVVVDPKFGFSADDAYVFMLDELKARGFEVFLDTPEYFTARARFPKDHVNRKITADFVMARKEGPYSDGRRPDWVEVGTLEDDLNRRDFTVNAMAKDEDGNIIDLWEGREDLRYRVLDSVGDPLERFHEDALRVFRAFRFMVTKDFVLSPKVTRAMHTLSVLDKVEEVSVERIRDELHRCFDHDTARTVHLLAHDFPELLSVMVSKGIWLEPTLKARKSAPKPKKTPSEPKSSCTGFGGAK